MPRPKILLVDDNRLFLEMEKEFLQPCAVRIYTARTGEEALDTVRMILPDLVFMDLQMPGMDGAACCAAIKADPDLKRVPVVMIVTSTDEADLERCRRAGCDFVLSKPIDRAAFIRTGHRFLPEIERIELRTPCVTLAAFRMGETAFYGTSVNVSTCGMFIAFDGPVEVEDRVSLSFLVPGSDCEVVEATGRIAWINGGSPLPKPSLPHGFGVEFTAIPPEATHAIAAFMTRAGSGTGDPHLEEAYLADGLF